MKILVLKGDGIGPEIVAAAETVVKAASRRFNLGLEIDYAEIGLESPHAGNGRARGRSGAGRARGG